MERQIALRSYNSVGAKDELLVHCSVNISKVKSTGPEPLWNATGFLILILRKQIIFHCELIFCYLDMVTELEAIKYAMLLDCQRVG